MKPELQQGTERGMPCPAVWGPTPSIPELRDERGEDTTKDLEGFGNSIKPVQAQTLADGQLLF